MTTFNRSPKLTLVIGVLFTLILIMVAGVALMAAQNPLSVTVYFWPFQSVPIPLGITLSFGVLGGLMSGLILWILGLGRA